MRTDNGTKKNGFNGYFTLEAAFLVPAAFFLFAFVIHVAFLMYGRCLMVPDAYLPAMREKIAAVLEIPADRVNVKATTEEKMGFTGREEGIAAHAVCLLNE